MTETSTPANVAQTANMADAIDLHALTLLGVFIKQDTATALLRGADGSISTVTIGDTADGRTITAIAEDAVYLLDAFGTQVILQLPT